MEKMLKTYIFSFPHNVLCHSRDNFDILRGSEVTVSHNASRLDMFKTDILRLGLYTSPLQSRVSATLRKKLLKKLWEKEAMLVTSISPFPAMLSVLSKTEIIS